MKIDLRVVLGIAVWVAVAAIASPALATPTGGDGTLSVAGRVGPLYLGRSVESNIVAFAGRPAATHTINFGAIPRDPNALEMGYGCQEHRQGQLQVVDRFDYCQTVFYINEHTHRLSAFFTTSSRYSFAGATPGMTTASAEAHINEPAQAGCLSGFNVGYEHDTARFFGSVQGGHIDKATAIIGGHLTSMALESNRYPIGLLFC